MNIVDDSINSCKTNVFEIPSKNVISKVINIGFEYDLPPISSWNLDHCGIQ